MHQLAAIESSHIILGVLGLVVIGIAAYYVVRALKGKIVLELPKKGFNGGEEIAGRVTLVTKKALQLNRMHVALIGYEIIEKRNSNGKSSTRRNEIYRNEITILEAQQLPAGLNQAFDFTLNAPGGRSEQVDETAAKVAGALSTAASALNMLGLTKSHSRKEWKIEARADLPGVDIAQSKKVRINLL